MSEGKNDGPLPTPNRRSRRILTAFAIMATATLLLVVGLIASATRAPSLDVFLERALPQQTAAALRAEVGEPRAIMDPALGMPPQLISWKPPRPNKGTASIWIYEIGARVFYFHLDAEGRVILIEFRVT